MLCGLVLRRPRAYGSSYKKNDSKGQTYRQHIQEAFTRRYEHLAELTGDLYGIVYCFYPTYNETIDADADNISKPVWDCLTGFLYHDDAQVKLRIAGCYDLSKNQLTDLDVTNLPDDIRDDLLNAIDQKQPVMYLECGVFKADMIRFNLE